MKSISSSFSPSFSSSLVPLMAIQLWLLKVWCVSVPLGWTIEVEELADRMKLCSCLFEVSQDQEKLKWKSGAHIEQHQPVLQLSPCSCYRNISASVLEHNFKATITTVEMRLQRCEGLLKKATDWAHQSAEWQRAAFDSISFTITFAVDWGFRGKFSWDPLVSAQKAATAKGRSDAFHERPKGVADPHTQNTMG